MLSTGTRTVAFVLACAAPYAVGTAATPPPGATSHHAAPGEDGRLGGSATADAPLMLHANPRALSEEGSCEDGNLALPTEISGFTIACSDYTACCELLILDSLGVSLDPSLTRSATEWCAMPAMNLETLLLGYSVTWTLPADVDASTIGEVCLQTCGLCPSPGISIRWGRRIYLFAKYGTFDT